MFSPWSLVSRMDRIQQGNQIAPLVVAGLASLGGSIFSGIMGASAQDSANETNMALAAQNRDFTRFMSDTSAQRGVADMRAAGLNPLASFGGGASSSSTSAAEVAASNPASGVGGLGSAIQTALDVDKTKAAVEVADAQEDNLRQDNKKKISETQLNNAAMMTELEKAKATAASAREVDLRANLLRRTTESKVSQERLKGDQSEYDRKMLNYDNVIKRAQGLADVASSAVDVASPIGKAVKTVKDAKTKAELMKELNGAYRRGGR